MVIADGDGDDVNSRWLYAASSAHQVLCDDSLSVEVELEATASDASTGGPAAAPPARRNGIGNVVAVVGGRHYVADVCVMSRRFEFMYCYNRGAKWFVMVVVVVSIYIFLWRCAGPLT